MSYSKETTYYNLPQYLGDDKPAWLTDINSAFNTIDSTLHSLSEAAPTNLTTRVSTLETTTSDLSGKVSTNTSNISSNTADITSLKSSLATTDENVANNTSVLSSLNTSLSSTDDKVDTNTSNISTLQTNLSTVQSNLETVQSDLATRLVRADIKGGSNITIADDETGNGITISATTSTEGLTEDNITSSYSGTATDLVLSQSGANSLYNAVSSIASSASSTWASTSPTTRTYSSLETGFSGNVDVFRWGKVRILYATVTTTTELATGEHNVVTLDSDDYPMSRVDVIGRGSGRHTFACLVTTAGIVGFEQYGNSTSASSIPSGTTLRAYAAWLTE